MSFSNLNKEKLLKAAKLFDIEVKETDTNAEIVAALEEGDATWSNYKKFLDKDKEESPHQGTAEEPFAEPAAQAVSFEEKMVVVKMERKNPSFEILGHKFTKAQPFKVVSEQEAQRIIESAEGGGFRIATPAETRSYFA